VYCRIGSARATIGLYSPELIGYPNVRNYEAPGRVGQCIGIPFEV